MKSGTIAEPSSQREQRTDLENLQGAWASVLGNRDTEFMVAGHHFTMRFRGMGSRHMEIYMGTFNLDHTAEPPRMDMFIEEGPGVHRGKTALCIYELRGDTLLWCPNLPGAVDRLKAFPPEDDERFLYTVFRREWL